MVSAMLLLMSPVWTPMFMISDEMHAKGVRGGEGGQWPRSIAISSDGKTMFLGIDVGGIYRSLDGGNNWHQASVGFSPRGAASIAIDPRNPDRVIAIGANSLPMDHHGVWLSVNRGANWKPVLPVRMGGLSDFRDQIAFDPSSFDPAKQRCTRVIWSRIGLDKPHWGDTINHPALYESTDGGDTWRETSGTEKYAIGFIRFVPGLKNLAVAGNENGLFVRRENAWSQVLAEPITGLDVANGQAVATTKSQILTFTATSTGLKITHRFPSPAPANYELRNLKISPLDPKRMTLWTEPNPNNWDWRRYASEDSGKTWTQSSVSAEDCFLPNNARQGLFAWNPAKSNQVFSLGGDWITVSNDGGKKFARSNAGQGGILVGGSFQFSATNPDVCFFGSQDYNGALSVNGGKSWKYINPSGNGWGGFTYGGYALNAKTLWVGDAPGWGGPRRLKVSDDGGVTWRDTDQDFKGMDISNGIASKPNIGFASDLRTEDGGKNWTRMPDCDGVVFSSASSRSLLGISKRGENWSLLESQNDGKTWTPRFTSKRQIYDACLLPGSNRILVAAGDLCELVGSDLKVIETPKDEFGNRHAKTVAFDPQNPTTIYLGNNANIYSANNAVCRSLDSGKTWQVISPRQPLKNGEYDGGRETFWIRVHPKTGEAWCATSCYGWWKVK